MKFKSQTLMYISDTFLCSENWLWDCDMKHLQTMILSVIKYKKKDSTGVL